MNKTLVAFVIFAVISFAYCDESSSEEILDKIKSNKLKTYIKNSGYASTGLDKIEEKCPGVGDKLTVAVEKFMECDDKVDNNLSLCEQIRQAGLNCTRPLIQVIDDCLPASGKGLPLLGVQSFISAADHFCKMTGEDIIELANPCLWEDPETLSPALQDCEKKFDDAAKKHKDDIPTKSEICNFATDMRSCLQLHVDATCTNPKAKSSLMGIYDAVVAPCSASNQV